jgi:hypothetical protein
MALPLWAFLFLALCFGHPAINKRPENGLESIFASPARKPTL